MSITEYYSCSVILVIARIDVNSSYSLMNPEVLCDEIVLYICTTTYTSVHMSLSTMFHTFPSSRQAPDPNVCVGYSKHHLPTCTVHTLGIQ